MKKLIVKTLFPYPVYVGQNLLTRLPSLMNKNKYKSAYIIADKKLIRPRKVLLKSFKDAGWMVFEIPVQAGESLKDMATLYPVYGKLISLGARRDSVIIALGGGSVGDAAGFIAATYLRGIAWVGVPTTLLSQVDSSVGGKTGINHSLGKNLIGAFHQPELVICDLRTLATLSSREMVSGLGEAVKYGLIYDRKFFDYIKDKWSQALNFDAKVLEKIIFQSLKFKAETVSKDERDILGVREFLNFGHTFGHGLEGVTKYRVFQHGEAVIGGMRFASALSFLRGQMSQKDFSAIDSFLRTIPIPKFTSLKPQRIFKIMLKDKKFRQGKLNFVLLKSIGRAVSDHSVALADLKQAWSMIGEEN